MKKVLINCYEGTLLFVNVNDNESRENIVERARQEINKDRQRKLTGLNNIEFVVNPSYDKLEDLEGLYEEIKY